MIKSIHIQNFQSHQDSQLEFSEGVNAIIGPSDSGKTAIIRALRWLVWNRPLGDEFRSNWGGETSVVIGLDCSNLRIPGGDYTTVSRFKTKNENIYLGGNDIEFNAIKAEVPEEIQRVLNINEINLQLQLARPFLLDDSPGEVGAHFNRIAHLDVIDTGNQNVQKWIRSIEQDIRSGEQYLIQQRAEFEKYEHLDILEQQVQVLETLDKQRETNIQRIGKLKRLLLDIEQTEGEIVKRSTILSLQVPVIDVLKLIDDRKKLNKKYDELEEVVDQISNLNNRIKESQKILGAESIVINSLKLHERKRKKEKEHEALTAIIFQLRRITTEYEKEKIYLTTIQKQFDDEFPDVCPLCGQRRK